MDMLHNTIHKTLRKIFIGLVLLGVMSLGSVTAWAEVDINTANSSQLANAMVGVGEKKAAEIVSYRELNGPFKTIDELAKVKGIGQATVEKNRERLVVK